MTIAPRTVNSGAVPIYEYQCQGKCKQLFEYMQSMKDPPKKKCEKCGGKLEKQISAAGFVLKGGGWYKDLYASSKPGSSGDSDSSPASTSSDASSKSSGESKTETKPESKTESKSESKSETKSESKSSAKPAAKKKSSKGK